MKKTHIALLILCWGVFLLILGVWALSVQGLAYINYCPELLPHYWRSPRNEWQIASTRGNFALIIAPQGYHSVPGLVADFESFGPSGLNLDENFCFRILGVPYIGQQTRVRPFSGVEKYWALRVPYWSISLILLLIIRRLRLDMVRAGAIIKSPIPIIATKPEITEQIMDVNRP